MKIPFKVNIRHNVHDGNRHEMDELEAFVKDLADKSGNDLRYCPVPDDECRECAWLPHCVGGCPHKRLFEGRQCVAFKDDPESYVLALHARIGEGRG